MTMQQKKRHLRAPCSLPIPPKVHSCYPRSISCSIFKLKPTPPRHRPFFSRCRRGPSSLLVGSLSNNLIWPTGWHLEPAWSSELFMLACHFSFLGTAITHTLDRWQAQFPRDIRVLDAGSFLKRHAFDQLGEVAGRSNGRTAAKCLESHVRDDLGLWVYPNLELHHVATGRRTHEAGSNVRICLGQRSRVSWSLVVVQNLVMVRSGHGGCCGSGLHCASDTGHRSVRGCEQPARSRSKPPGEHGDEIAWGMDEVIVRNFSNIRA